MERDFLQERDYGREFCRSKAEGVLAQLRVSRPPIDVEAVATHLGLYVRRVRRGSGFHGQLLKERLEIEVEETTHPHRQRFTIAHEIGHFVLDHNPVVCSIDDRAIWNPRSFNESQANTFAAVLLMPEVIVRDEWKRNSDYREVAKAFVVSPEAMWRRLEDLDLLGLERRL